MKVSVLLVFLSFIPLGIKKPLWGALWFLYTEKCVAFLKSPGGILDWGVEREEKRACDITNVLCGLHLIQNKPKNHTQWMSVVFKLFVIFKLWSYKNYVAF